MAGRNIAAQQAVVTGATAAGFLTVTSAAGLYVAAKCWLSNTAGTLQDFVEITEINGTSIGVRHVAMKGEPPNYGRTNVSAYNAGGFLSQEPQFVFNRNDAPAP